MPRSPVSSGSRITPSGTAITTSPRSGRRWGGRGLRFFPSPRAWLPGPTSGGCRAGVLKRGPQRLREMATGEVPYAGGTRDDEPAQGAVRRPRLGGQPEGRRQSAPLLRERSGREAGEYWPGCRGIDTGQGVELRSEAGLEVGQGATRGRCELPVRVHPAIGKRVVVAETLRPDIQQRHPQGRAIAPRIQREPRLLQQVRELVAEEPVETVAVTGLPCPTVVGLQRGQIEPDGALVVREGVLRAAIPEDDADPFRGRRGSPERGERGHHAFPARRPLVNQYDPLPFFGGQGLPGRGDGVIRGGWQTLLEDGQPLGRRLAAGTDADDEVEAGRTRMPPARRGSHEAGQPSGSEPPHDPAVPALERDVNMANALCLAVRHRLSGRWRNC